MPSQAESNTPDGMRQGADAMGDYVTLIRTLTGRRRDTDVGGHGLARDAVRYQRIATYIDTCINGDDGADGDRQQC